VQASFVESGATGFIVVQAKFQRPETARESDTLEHMPILGSVQQSTVPVQKMLVSTSDSR